jgi:hypothetical protein
MMYCMHGVNDMMTEYWHMMALPRPSNNGGNPWAQLRPWGRGRLLGESAIASMLRANPVSSEWFISVRVDLVPLSKLGFPFHPSLAPSSLPSAPAGKKEKRRWKGEKSTWNMISASFRQLRAERGKVSAMRREIRLPERNKHGHMVEREDGGGGREIQVLMCGEEGAPIYLERRYRFVWIQVPSSVIHVCVRSLRWRVSATNHAGG